jgi:hypothetical protein
MRFKGSIGNSVRLTEPADTLEESRVWSNAYQPRGVKEQHGDC